MCLHSTSDCLWRPMTRQCGDTVMPGRKKKPNLIGPHWMWHAQGYNVFWLFVWLWLGYAKIVPIQKRHIWNVLHKEKEKIPLRSTDWDATWHLHNSTRWTAADQSWLQIQYITTDDMWLMFTRSRGRYSFTTTTQTPAPLANTTPHTASVRR